MVKGIQCSLITPGPDSSLHLPPCACGMVTPPPGQCHLPLDTLRPTVQPCAITVPCPPCLQPEARSLLPQDSVTSPWTLAGLLTSTVQPCALMPNATLYALVPSARTPDRTPTRTLPRTPPRTPTRTPYDTVQCCQP